MDTLPTAVWVLAAVAVVGIAVTLAELARRDVRHLPKWAWALVVVLVSFPVGAVLYFVVGRVPPGESAWTSTGGTTPSRGTTPATGTPPTPGTAPRLHARDRARTAGKAPASGPPAVTTRGLAKRYGDTLALSDVDLLVPRGVTYGLIGPNGAGKTTMLSIIAGLRRPTSGEFALGVPRTSLGVLVDTPQFEPWLTAREVVDLSRHLTAPGVPGDRVDEVLAEVGLTDAADRRNGGFSRGMLQRLGLAACLVGDPEVLLLDEPSSALDPAGRREVLDLIGRLSHRKTVVLSTHILSDVQQVCDTVGVIDQGRLRFQGALADLLTRTTSAYEIQVRAPVTDLASALRGQAWVRDVTEQGPGRLRMVVSDAAEAEREVPRLVAERQLPLVTFHPATDLEQAFLELTT